MAQSMHPAVMPLKVFTERHNVLKQTYLGLWKLCQALKLVMLRVKYKTISYIRANRVVVLKWRPLADSVIVAPLADVFSSILQIAR